ncbi:MAG: rod shape-determining protein MreC [Candidatus Krumholzibacteria bacterium]|nr:rod shape-determining protein MreC [Candidatus Krumholzibacteria bacterium]MDH4336071.1 rod shape-determining protein MreC [Candidatus Krumholzibacteria bacterium]MDH5268353.1 rod shape-determining protein MreC [Candidatus Krumholzibacteria bacterium]MDH5626707.1 rod shape-determining protein MreC [Candidatus Krumholzibacteria bacterium]
MRLFEDVFHRHRDRTVFAVLVAASLALLALPEPVQLDIARGVLDRALLPFQRISTFIADYSSIRDENERLRRMVATMVLERERLLQFRDERERLRRLAEFKEEQTRRLTPAEVVGRDLDRIQTNLIIDKGSQDGLKERMPVFSFGGLAGTLSRVFPESAWVQLLCSKNLPVSCVDKRSRVVGVLEWRHRNLFEMKHVGATEDVIAGDTLITSGFGGTIPKGFPIAIVTRVATSSDGLSLRVDARSPVDFLALEEVFVMTEEIPWDRSLFYDEADTSLMRDVLLRPGRRR